MPNTQSKEVNLTKRVQTSKGLRYYPVVLSPNGRVKPVFVIVNGRPERHSEGGVLLEWREKGRRIRLSVGKDHRTQQPDASARKPNSMPSTMGCLFFPKTATVTLRPQLR